MFVSPYLKTRAFRILALVIMIDSDEAGILQLSPHDISKEEKIAVTSIFPTGLLLELANALSQAFDKRFREQHRFVIDAHGRIIIQVPGDFNRKT